MEVRRRVSLPILLAALAWPFAVFSGVITLYAAKIMLYQRGQMLALGLTIPAYPIAAIGLAERLPESGTWRTVAFFAMYLGLMLHATAAIVYGMLGTNVLLGWD